jgi:hypothetical protein
MSRHDDLMRLACEAEDLAEALEGVLTPVDTMVGRMTWSGPHRDRVQVELGTMIRITGTIAERLRDRAELLRRTAADSASGWEGLERIWEDVRGLL